MSEPRPQRRPDFDEVLAAARRRPVRNICPCVHCAPFLDAPHGNGCVGYHCSGSCIRPDAIVATGLAGASDD